ncbi:hypothetical protein FQN54_008152 [Arachnomyces sp. PD_36]|nr:hypothetical protein FQN54_008152 [Arachnomyces sp. PD_36]
MPGTMKPNGKAAARLSPSKAPPSPRPQVVPDSPAMQSLSSMNLDELKPVLVGLIKDVLNSWPRELPATPVFPFGPSTPPLDADKLDQLLVQASDAAGRGSSQSVSTDTKLGKSARPADDEVLQGAQSSQDAADATKSSAPPAQSSSKSNADDKGASGTSGVQPRASVMGFKKVIETWDKDTSKYKIVESIETDDATNDLDKYLFVVREHIDKRSKEVTSYIDVKSDPLREILRDVLRDVKAVSLMEDKPSIKENILFHFRHELDDYAEKLRNSAGTNATQLDHLILLINHIKDTYSATIKRLTSLLQHGQITYDLLWTLFEPGCRVYTKCFGTQKPRCVIFDAGEEVTERGVTYYKLECRYLDYDGKLFGEAEICLGVVKFQGSKPISSLAAFPLTYHPDHERVRANLIECGKKFCDLKGTHIRQCNGVGFIMHHGDIVQMNINSHVGVDAAFFCEMRPNYSRPRLQDTWTSTSGVATICIDSMFDAMENETAKSKETEQLREDDLLICCPTVRCFSFKDKCFLECAVADLKKAEWSTGCFDDLKIPEDTKQTIVSLATTRLGLIPTVPFDDVIEGKGRGLNVLLHGPPGVGKTFTVEATSQKFSLPLYSISAGELIVQHGDPHNLDVSLGEIFKIAKHFNAVLLLDEADVFMECRTSYHDSHNQLLIVFLRKLEYYEGILFLTTNRVTEFDEAILSRIHLKVKYGNLTKDARQEIWEYFLSKARTGDGPSIVGKRDLERLGSMTLNGRDIKNLTSIAHALATFDKTQMTYQHLEKAAKSNDKFVEEFNDYGRMEGLYT